ncbi:MAG: TetR/AcrR family transcriptional regulator [Pseudodonghicola sp.]|nr:TetR/AcrR family transcriptional regulator [Pseudodonghicola sp.]
MRQAGSTSSPWVSRRDRAAERQSKRDAVLRTAVRFFNAQGFHATSLDDVARALSVTKPTIYHYFSNKDEILFECVRLGLETIRDATEAAHADGGPARDRLETFMREYALVMTRDFGICVTRTSDDQLGDESRAKFRALKREINEGLQSLVEEGMRDGSLAPGNAQVVAFTVAGALNWIARWYRPEGGLSAQQVADNTVATLIHGLIPRAPAS